MTKKEVANQASKHTTEMMMKYMPDIMKCVKETIIYPIDMPIPKDNTHHNPAKFELVNIDSVSAIFEFAQANKRTAVLNFASYKEAGGLFLKGSTAQEEALCHESFLFNVLRNFENSYYAVNCKQLNRGLYKNTALYSPNVIFFRGEKSTPCDVITCAAPNRNVGIKYTNVSLTENNKVLYNRIEYIKDIALNQNVDTLILGAYGCGVFKQDATTVATYIKEIFANSGLHVVMAIPGNSDNYKKFKEIF
jgi:TIGR02452 family protein